MRGWRPPRVRRAGFLLAGLFALVAATPAGGADATSTLRARNATLAAQSHAAALDLYALDAKLARAQTEFASLEAAAARVEAERAAAATELAAARATLAHAQRQLGAELRELYEQGDPDPLAVVFGATSLEELVTGFDDLSRAARTTTGVVREARDARVRVGALAAVLAARKSRLERLSAAAEARQATLAAARIERDAFLNRLRDEQRLNAEQIAHLEAQARAAEARAELATVRAHAGASVLSFGAQAPLRVETLAEPSPPAPPSGRRTIVVLSTGYALPGTTATGLPVGPGVVAVDPTVIPLGTHLTIPGYGEGIAADTGSAIKGNRIDLWFPTRTEALAWGWQTLTVTVR